MPPKIKFTREDATRAALSIVKEEGFNELTMRKVAERLGSSIQPVYSCFETKQELERRILEEIKRILSEYAAGNYTESRSLNMAIGVVLFARDFSQLFRSLFLQDWEFKGIFKEFNQYHITQVKSQPRFARLSPGEREKLLSRLWIFTYGFATMMSAGLIPDRSDEGVVATLREVGSDMLKGVLNP